MNMLKKSARKTPEKPGKPRKSDRTEVHAARRQVDADSALQTIGLDMRTNTARQLLAIREAVAENPLQTASGVMRDLLAVNALLMREIVKEVAASDVRVVDDVGEIHPLIGKTWFALQGSLVQGCKTLMQLEAATRTTGGASKASADTGPLDVSAVILEESNRD